MIITRSPLRISLGGGGTDLPSYYKEHTGFLIAAAITKYVYITVHKTFVPELIIKYSKMERVNRLEEVEHPIIRESLRLTGAPLGGLEITSMADIPAGTGLGSSGSFTTALLRALHTLAMTPVQPQELAEQACHIEIDLLGEPIGKQDQYVAAYGGLNCFRFHSNGQVEIVPLNISEETMFTLEDNLLLFFTGYARSASLVLKEQDSKSRAFDKEMTANLHFIKELGRESKTALEAGDLNKFAELMNAHWEHKKKRAKSMSNDDIEGWYKLALANGALGGKLIGAGGGGFLMFYTEDRVRLRKAMHEAGLKEVRFAFDFRGTTVLNTAA
jgi:D-glycero-alpha-D-manno-heptose-7-phosphate kinase